MARTVATSSSLTALVCSLSWSMPMSTTPGSPATAGSTSPGMARSMITSGLCTFPAGRAVLGRQLDRRTHLAEDLVLADHHRVEAGRHREQVAHRAVLVVHVQVLGQLVRRHAAVPREQLADGGDARVEAVHVGVHLH